MATAEATPMSIVAMRIFFMPRTNASAASLGPIPDAAAIATLSPM